MLHTRLSVEQFSSPKVVQAPIQLKPFAVVNFVIAGQIERIAELRVKRHPASFVAPTPLKLRNGGFSTFLATELSREGDSSWRHSGYILAWRVIMSKGGSRLASRCSCQGGWPATSSGCRLVSGNFQRM